MSIQFRSLAPLAVAAATLVGAPVQAGDFVGLDKSNSRYYTIDTTAQSATLVGTVTGGPPFGFSVMDRGDDHTLYAIGPGAVTGYTIYAINESTLQASPLHAVASGQAGTVGVAVEPGSGAIWVAGYVASSFIVQVDRVDLATGTRTDQGKTGGLGSSFGLAFDSAGDLFLTTFGASGLVLLKINQTDAALSTTVGPLTGIDVSSGVDLASDTGSGSIHALSRAAKTVHSIDTSTGAGTLVATLSGASGITTIAEPGCQLVNAYGAGCAGSGGFVPDLTFNGCPAAGTQISIEITNGLGGAPCVILFGTGQASIPVGSGCSLLLSGVLPFSLPLPLGGTGPSHGSIFLPAVLPTPLPSVTFTMQAFVGDPASGTGYSNSNGVEVIFP